MPVTRPPIISTFYLACVALFAVIGWQIHSNRTAAERLAEAVQATRTSAEQGDPDAEVDLGSRYVHADGVPQDYGEALRWFRKSADQGSASGQYHVGVMYYYGRAVPQDYGEAIRLFRTAAAENYATAQDQLGTMLANGIALPRNEYEAFSWYRKSASLGYARGEEHLGTMYYYGRGVTQDYAQAVLWYRKAADQGDPTAEYDLGAMYHDGQSVPRNLAEARRWLRKTAAHGNEDALRAITLGRSTPAQIALRIQFVLGLLLALNFVSFNSPAPWKDLRTYRQKVTSAAGGLILFSAGYDWYGYTHSRILLPVYGLDAFTAFYWLLSVAVIASIVYIVRLGKRPDPEGNRDTSPEPAEYRDRSPSSGPNVPLSCD